MKTKAVLITSLIAAATALSVACTGAAEAMPRSYSALDKNDLRSTISTNGTVGSLNRETVYSSVNYPVKEICAEVGDEVKAGDVLCIIDSADLASQIAVKEAAMEAANINSYYQLSQSEKQYNEVKKSLENGTNAELANAEAARKSAELQLESARKSYEDAQRSLDKSMDGAIMDVSGQLKESEWNLKCAWEEYYRMMDGEYNSLKTAAQSLENKVSSAKSELKSAENELNSAKISNLSMVEEASAKVKSAQEKYDEAIDDLYSGISGGLLYQRYKVEGLEAQSEALREQLDGLLNSVGGEISQLKNAMDSAQLNYDNAVISYNATEISVNQQLENLKSAMERDQSTISKDPQLIELDMMKKQLADCTVTAPADGTVTAVNVSEGAIANGILFVVEDTENLKISASVKEYNIGDINPGQKVIIRSDATGDTEYEGEVTKVAPAATQDLTGMGNTETSFAVEIKVTSRDTRLLIGMNTKLKIVTEEKKNVYSVRYDAVAQDENGNDIIYAAEENGEGTCTVRAVPVTLGMETDLEVEITGDGLTDGMKILTDINYLQPGQTVTLKEDK